MQAAKDSNAIKGGRIAVAQSAAVNNLVASLNAKVKLPPYLFVVINKNKNTGAVVAYNEYPVKDIGATEKKVGTGVVVFKVDVEKKNLKQPPVYVSPNLGMPS